MARGVMVSRLIALIIDEAIILIVARLLAFVIGDLRGALGVIVGLVYFWFFWVHRNGQTPAKRCLSCAWSKRTAHP